MKKSGWGLIIITFIFSLIFLIIPLPPALIKIRPLFPLLLVIYWVACCPDRVGIAIAWFMGLITDFLYGVILGPYAMGFAIVAYFIFSRGVRFKMVPLFQQLLTVFSLTLGVQLGMMLVAFVLKLFPLRLSDLWIVLTTTLTWPIIIVCLGCVRLRSQAESS